MAALDAPDVRGLVLMALQAAPVHLAGSGFRWIEDVRGRGRFRVFGSRAMARFATLALPAALLAGFHGLMRVLLERLNDVFVTPLARLRSHIGGGLIGGLLLLRRLGRLLRRSGRKSQDQQKARRKTGLLFCEEDLLESNGHVPY